MPHRNYTPEKLTVLQKSLQDLNYIAAVDEMIPEAMKVAKKRYLETPIDERNPLLSSKGELPFKSCTISKYYHQEMNRKKREAGLIN